MVAQLWPVAPINRFKGLRASTSAWVLALHLTLLAGSAMAQTPLPQDPLDDRSAKRLERMEKVVRELRSIVFQGRDTGKPVIVQPAETDARLESLGRRISDLEQSLSVLNADNERMAHNLDITVQELAAVRRENDALRARIDALDLAAQKAAQELAPQAPEPTAAADTPPQIDAASAYSAASSLLKSGDLAGAEEAFEAFVRDYPTSTRLAEAKYRLGDIRQARKAYPQAAAAYVSALKGWPQTPWAPDALVKLSQTLNAMGDRTRACAALDEFAQRYPKASVPLPARAAAERVRGQCPT
jgi:tol-pal system protein YbgF